MGTEKKKRCKHDLVEGTCSNCAGVPPLKDTRDLLETSRKEYSGRQNCVYTFAQLFYLDPDKAPESACRISR